MDLHNATAAKVGLTGRLLLHSTSITTIQIGSSNLQDRKWVIIQNQSNANLAFSFLVSDLTTPTVAHIVKQGVRLRPGDIVSFPLSENVTLYGCSVSGTGNAISLSELA